MKTIIALCFLAFVACAYAQAPCKTLKWATCDSPTSCTVLTDDGFKQTVDCSNLVPKCFLMKAEMYRARNNMGTRSIGGKPLETAIVDNDGIYEPECNTDGRFKAVQCNNTETCWCVNSAGVRRSDKGDRNIKCESVETYWVRLQMTHKDAGPVDRNVLQAGLSNALQKRYGLAPTFVKSVQYDDKARMIVVDVQKDKGEKVTDLSRMAYYMEKDIKIAPLFTEQSGFHVMVGGTNLTMDSILIYYVDELPPTFTMQRLTGGVIAVIVVVILAVLVGLLVLFFVRRRDKAQYTKAQARELDTMS